MDEMTVQAKAMEMGLAETTSTLTQQDKVLARYQLILDQTQVSQGDFSRTSKEMANQTRILNAEWGDLQDTLGTTVLPTATLALQGINVYLADQLRQLKEVIALWDALSAAMNRIAHLDFSGPPQGPPADVTGGGGTGSFSGDAQTAPDPIKIAKAQSDYFDHSEEITRQANADILSENQSYLSRRGQMEEQYQESVARSAADFAKNRMRAQEDYENSIVDVIRSAQQRDARMAEDHARQMERMASDHSKRLGDLQEELDRSNGQRRADSAERVADLTAKHDEDLADKRADSVQKLLDIEKDYERQRLLALRDHQDSLSDAASRLDANAVFMEQRRFGREQEAAGKAHEEKVNDEQEKLQEAIDNLNTAYDKKLADEQEALNKSIDQANEAHQRQVDDENESFAQRSADANAAYEQQLADAKAADAQRITDMAAHFEEQKRREDEDQVDRMNRMATDHTQEMTQLGTEHTARLTQISTHAQEERDQLDAEFRKQMHDLGVHNDAYNKAEAQHQEQIKLRQAIFQEQEKRQLVDTQIALLNILKTNPLLSPGEITALNTSLTALGQTLVTIDTNIGIAQGKLDKLPANPYALDAISSTGTPSSGVVSAAGIVGAAGGLSVTIASGAIQISGVSGQTANQLADIIDERLLAVFQQAAGFGSGR
jgi:hypothetical protein